MKKIKGLFPAQTISGSCRIDMRFMLRNGCIVQGEETLGVLEWTKGQAVQYRCKMTTDEKYLQLTYSITNRQGKSSEYDYKIFIDEVKSNLGKGTILYFICPESGKRSRILVSAYGEPKFLNREHYQTKYGLRVYYGCQQTSKNDYHNTRYFDLKRKVDRLESELNEKHRNTHYRGRPTKDQERLTELKIKMEFHNHKRISILEEYSKRAYSKSMFNR